jgi:SAM-dependent methyltransferase
VALTCPVCEDTRVRTKLRKQGVEILQCAACRLAFWIPGAGFDPSSLYDGDYFASEHAAHGYDDYAALEPALRATFRRRLAKLGGATGAKLLDVGAAYGFAASEAERAGFRVFAAEISADAARHAGALVPGRVLRASADHLPFGTACFDVVTLWDVIEHLPAPHAAVSEIARCLRPGGRLVLTTGDVGSLVAWLSGARWHLYTLPEHLFFYSRESLRRLLGSHGFRVETIRAEGALYPVGYLVERLRKTLVGRSRTGSIRFPGAGLVVPVNLFDVITVTARREAAP